MILNWESIFCEIRERNSIGTTTKDLNQSINIRNEFDKDYERIVYSSSVRRLQDKAQVFPLQENDFTRTRLTHSLEVASLGDSMAWQISNNLNKKGHASFNSTEKMKRLPSMVKTACLVHDLGNPPFGHYGETVIKNWFNNFFSSKDNNSYYYLIKKRSPENLNNIKEKEKNDFTKFDGNAQTIRILLRLQNLNDEFGINFTYGTLATLMKYPWASEEHPENKHKFGYMYSEKNVFEKIKKNVNIGPHRSPATLIMEAADDIAYLTADIEDAVKKSIISWNDLEKDYKLIELLDELFEKSFLNKNLYDSFTDNIKTARSKKVPDLDVILYQNYKVVIQGVLIKTTMDTFFSNYNSIMTGTFKKSLLDNSPKEIKNTVNRLKNIAIENCFCCNEVVRLELVGDKVISDLLSWFIPAVLSIDDYKEVGNKNQKLVKLISENFIFAQKNTLDNKKTDRNFENLNDYKRIQMVVDFISGMTDSYAVNLHKQLSNGII